MLTVGDTLPPLKIPVQQGTTSLPGDETLDLGKTDGKRKVLFQYLLQFFIYIREVFKHVSLRQKTKKNHMAG